MMYLRKNSIELDLKLAHERIFYFLLILYSAFQNEKFQNNKSMKKDIKCFYLNETKTVSSHPVNVSQYNSYCDILANKVLVLEADSILPSTYCINGITGKK